MSLSSNEKLKSIPEPRGEWKSHKDILTSIGRGASDFSDKFTSWEHFFTTTSEEMEALGIPTKSRKWILNRREFFKRGQDPVELALPKRQKKYLKLQAKVEEARLKKKGLL